MRTQSLVPFDVFAFVRREFSADNLSAVRPPADSPRTLDLTTHWSDDIQRRNQLLTAGDGCVVCFVVFFARGLWYCLICQQYEEEESEPKENRRSGDAEYSVY